MRHDRHTARLKTLVSSSAPLASSSLRSPPCASLKAHRSGAVARDWPAFFVFISVAERYPVPVESTSLRGYSLATVFNVAGIVLFGWEPMIFVCVLSVVGGSAWTRQPPMKVAYNAAVLALAMACGGLLLRRFPAARACGAGGCGQPDRVRLRPSDPVPGLRCFVSLGGEALSGHARANASLEHPALPVRSLGLADGDRALAALSLT